jgi:hypothetical protein
MMPARRATAATDRRIAELERRAEQRLPDDAREREVLMSWISIEQREVLADAWEAALAARDDDGVLAAELQLEALLLIAQKRKADGLPRC